MATQSNVGSDNTVDSNGSPAIVILTDNETDNSLDFVYYLPNPRLTVAKTPDGGTFTIRAAGATFQILVSNIGGSPKPITSN